MRCGEADLLPQQPERTDTCRCCVSMALRFLHFAFLKFVVVFFLSFLFSPWSRKFLPGLWNADLGAGKQLNVGWGARVGISLSELCCPVGSFVGCDIKRLRWVSG